MGNGRTVRRTQAERTASTREGLLNAAVGSLVERGFARTTTTEVAGRAGVSLGALLHHFPTKAELLVAAVEHVVTRRQDEFRKSMADIGHAVDPLDAAIDLLWAGFEGPTFRAWVELWVGSTTDPQLRAAVRVMDARFERTSQEIFREFFPVEGTEDPELLESSLRFTLALMDGVALRGLVIEPTDRKPIEMLKVVARQALAGNDNSSGEL